MKSFYSDGQHLCEYIGTKESVYLKKSSALTGLVWYRHGRRFIVLEHQYGRRDAM